MCRSTWYAHADWPDGMAVEIPDPLGDALDVADGKEGRAAIEAFLGHLSARGWSTTLISTYAAVLARPDELEG